MWVAQSLNDFWGCSGGCSLLFGRTWIAHKVGMHVRRIVIKNIIFYKYETSTLALFVKPRYILNLATKCILHTSYVESTFTHNPGSTFCSSYPFFTLKECTSVNLMNITKIANLRPTLSHQEFRKFFFYLIRGIKVKSK